VSWSAIIEKAITTRTMSDQTDWKARFDRLNESLAKNKRMFSDELAQRLIESQTKRIQQLENELIETKYQLRKASETAKS